MPITRIPTAWNEIGFGGPASPRGYVRMGLDRRDPWEAVEATPGEEAACATEERPCRLIPSLAPRAANGRAPDVFTRRRLAADAPVRRRRGGRFRRRRHRRRRRSADRRPGRGRLLRRRLRRRARISGRWRISPPTRRSRTSSIGPTSAWWTAPTRSPWAARTAARRWAAARSISPWCRCASGRNGSSPAACSATAPTGRSIGARCGTTTPRPSRRSASPARSPIPGVRSARATPTARMS